MFNFVLFSFFLVASVLSFAGYNYTHLSALIYLLFLFIGIIKGKDEVSLPPDFLYLLAFAVILNIFPFFISEITNPTRYALIFNLGILSYFYFYNYGQGSHLLTGVIRFITIFYTGLYLLSFTSAINLTNVAGFIFPQTEPTTHFNLGLLWSMYLLTETYRKGIKIKTILVILTLVFVVLSFNRTVILGVVLSLLYLSGGLKTINSAFWKAALGLLVAALFIFMGLSKTTIFNRPYFVQSLKGYLENIWGVGMGNFGLLHDFILKDSGGSVQLSSYTHNLLTEVLVGVGVFSLPFVLFLIKTAFFVLKDKNINKGFVGVVIIMIVSFMFDYTYAAGAFIWLFFGFLGACRKQSISLPYQYKLNPNLRRV